MNFWLAKIGDMQMPRGEFALDTSRALTNEVAPVIGAQGVYFLNGARPLVGAQNYTYEYTLPETRCGHHLDGLMALALAEQSVYKTDGGVLLDTVGRISAIVDASSLSDLRSNTKRIRLTIVAEPFWYGSTRTLALDAAKTNPTVVAVADGPNAALNWGTAPSIKYTRFTGTHAVADTTLTLKIFDNGMLYTEMTMGAMAVGDVPWYIDAGVPEVIGASAGDQWRKVSRPATQVPLMAIPPVGRLGGKVNPSYVWSVQWLDGGNEVAGTLTWRDCYL